MLREQLAWEQAHKHHRAAHLSVRNSLGCYVEGWACPSYSLHTYIQTYLQKVERFAIAHADEREESRKSRARGAARSRAPRAGRRAVTLGDTRDWRLRNTTSTKFGRFRNTSNFERYYWQTFVGGAALHQERCGPPVPESSESARSWTSACSDSIRPHRAVSWARLLHSALDLDRNLLHPRSACPASQLWSRPKVCIRKLSREPSPDQAFSLVKSSHSPPSHLPRYLAQCRT